MNPSLALIPSAYSAGKLYSVLPEDGTGDFNVSRNGTATYFDKNGIIQTAQANEPRLDYDPVTGEFKGVLVEPAATNLLLRSEDFENSYWGKQNISVIQTNAVSPSGQLNASLIQESNLFNTQRILSPVINYTTQNSLSLYVKYVNARFINLSLGGMINNPIFENRRADFDIVNGTVLRDTTYSSTAKINSIGNGWFRISFANQAPSVSSFNRFIIYFLDSSGSDNTVIQGESRQLLIWGAQLETGSVATSYIPTEDSTVTRPADIITLPNYSTLFGERNNRLVTINGENKIYINESNLQLPVGHNKLLLEKQNFFTEQEQTDLSATTATYGVREDIKDELNEVLALNPSLVMIPGKGSIGGLQTIFPNDGTADFTVSRNGTATYLGSDGLIKTAQANEPRLEFDPVTGEFKGILVEPAATNLLLRSEEFDVSPWLFPFKGRVVSSTLPSPTGIGFFQRLEEFNTGAAIDIYETAQAINWQPNTTVVYSLFIKPDQITQIRIAGGSFIGTPELTFDLSTKQKLSGLDTFSFVEYPNDIIRLSLRFTTTNTIAGLSPVTIRLVRNGQSSYPLVNTGDGLFIWGAQLEVGSVATSYIATTDSQVTRPTDVIRKGDLQNIIGQQEGSIYMHLERLSSNRFGFSIDKNFSFNNTIQLFSNVEGFYIFRIRKGGIQVYASNFFSTSVLLLKVLVIYTQTIVKIYINGSLVFNDEIPEFSLPDELNSLSISTDSGNLPEGQTIKNYSIFKTPLTDEQAIALTTL